MNRLSLTLRFISYLLRHGSLKSKRKDYEKDRINSLGRFQNEIAETKNWYVTARSFFLKFDVLRAIIGNFAFILNHKKVYRKLFVVNNQKLIYLRIFKCGSTSILRSLLPKIKSQLNSQTITDAQIDSLAHYLQVNHPPKHFNQYTTFTIVRNPLERVVSAYLDVCSEGNYDDFLFGIFRENMTFKELLLLLDKIPDHLRGPHFASQCTIIQSLSSNKIITFKLGDENNSLQSFLAKYHLNLPHSNKSPKVYDYKKYYDLESLELIKRIYYHDFVQLGFEKQYNELVNSTKAI